MCEELDKEAENYVLNKKELRYIYTQAWIDLDFFKELDIGSNMEIENESLTVTMPEDDEDSEEAGFSNSVYSPKMKKDKFDVPSSSPYSRKRLHRSCKLVMENSGVSLLKLQQDFEREELQTGPPPVDVTSLPSLVWLKIFSYLLEESKASFMKNVPLVCKDWYTLCKSPGLWTCLRVPRGSKNKAWRSSFVKWMTRAKLTACRDADLTGCDITFYAIKKFIKKSPKLQTLNLSYCRKAGNPVVPLLLEYLPHLTSLDLSHSACIHCCPQVTSCAHCGTQTTDPATIRDNLLLVLDHYNSQLTSLALAGNTVLGFQTLIDTLCKKCPNMETLNFQYCRVDNFDVDVEHLQRSLLHLRVLHLRYFLAEKITIEERLSFLAPGFKSLEELTLAVGPGSDGRSPIPFNNNLIERFVVPSRQLRVLDLRGVQHYKMSSLASMQAHDLEKITVGEGTLDDQRGLPDLFKRYRHSLTEVKLSHSQFTMSDVIIAFNWLVTRGINYNLVTIDVENLDIERPLVRAISDYCPNLTSINMLRCRLMPRELRTFFDKNNIQTFRELINEGRR